MSVDGVTWHLFVDETGAFEKPEPVAVAGVLLDSGVVESSAKTLSADLRRLLPGMPLPWHSWLYGKLSGIAAASRIHRVHAVEWMLRDQSLRLGEAVATGDPAAVRAAFTRAEQGLEARFDVGFRDPDGLAHDVVKRLGPRAGEWDALDMLDMAVFLGGRTEQTMDEAILLAASEHLDECREVLGDLYDGREPRSAAMKVLERSIRKHASPRLVRSLEDHQALVWAAFRRVLRTRRSPHGSATVYLFVAGESRLRDWKPPEENDRYVALLRCLLGRVTQAVGRENGTDATVRLHVLSRWIRLRSEPNSFELDVRGLQQIALDAVSDEPGGAKLEAEEVRRFNKGAHAAYVLVDFAAGEAVPWLRGRLAKIHDRLELHIGAPVRSGSPARSHAVAAGWAWEHRQDTVALNAAVSTGQPAGLEPWAAAQALQWACREDVDDPE